MFHAIELLSSLLLEFKARLKLTQSSVLRQYHFPEVGNLIIVAMGMRRTGKTYLLFQEIRRLLIQEQIPIERILYLNLEDDRILPANKNDLSILI